MATTPMGEWVIKRCLQAFLAALFLLLAIQPTAVLALSQNDLNSIYTDSVYYDPNSGSCATPSSSGNSNSSPVAAGSKAYVLGDSITAMAQTAYTSAFQQKGITATIDGSSSRSLNGPGVDGNKLTGMQAIDADKAQISTANIIVVALGTNGGNTAQTIDKAVLAIRAINGSAPIYWVDTMVIGRPDYVSTINASNQAIYTQASKDKYQTVSWAKTVTPTADPQHLTGKEADTNKYIIPYSQNPSASLGVHPTPAGVTALVNLVVKAVLGQGGASTDATASSSSQACACSAGSTALSGSDNQAKIWNYFVGKGISEAGTAGIMGNMQAESGFNPAIEQAPGSWEDLSNSYYHAVGLVQWDGGRRPALIKFLKSKGISGDDLHKPTDKLLGAELDYVWQELTTSYKSTLDALKTATDPGQAAYTFHKLYEGSADSEDAVRANRMDPAIAIFKKFSTGGGSTSSGGSGSSGCGGGGAADCTKSVAGNAAIACAAQKYDPLSYSQGWHSSGSAFHQRCPTIGPDCATDCSGLVNIVLYDLFQNDMNENTFGEVEDTKNFKKIPFSQVKPGDLIQPNTDHVEIVVSVDGSTINTFGAHTSKKPQPDQVGAATWTDGPGNVYLRYIGTGSDGS